MIIRKICIYFSVLAVLLNMVGNLDAAEIIAFGDSITVGSGSFSGGYPPKLEGLLANNGQPSRLLNYGVGGEPTAYGSGRIDGSLTAQPNASYILILEGTNDLFHGMSLEATQFHLEAMINKSRNHGVTPLLATLTPDSQSLGAQKDIPGSYNPMIHSIGANLGVPIVDLYAAVAPNWGGLTADGIHPNDAGYQVIAQAWFAVLSPSIASGGGSGGGDGGGGGGCFVATAAFGSKLEKPVRLLSEFRDLYLLPNLVGQKFVQAYYHYSPPIADFIAKHEIVRLIIRLTLYPLVAFSFFMVKIPFHMKMAVLTACLFVSFLILHAFLHRKKRPALCH